MKPPMDHKVKRPFKYVPAAATDVSKTIAKAKASLKRPKVEVVEFRARARG